MERDRERDLCDNLWLFPKFPKISQAETKSSVSNDALDLPIYFKCQFLIWGHFSLFVARELNCLFSLTNKLS